MIETSKLVEAVRAVAAERPDFIYERIWDNATNTNGKCVYLYNGRPSCIVGHGFIRIGVSPDRLEAFDKAEDDSGIAPLALGEFDYEFNVEDQDHLDWLAIVQSQQDQGETWGAAVELADHEVDLANR